MTNGSLALETDRVRRNTARPVNHQIDRAIRRSIRFYGSQPREAVSQRIEELDAEWDIERVLETNASTLALTGLVLGTTVHRKWLLLTGGVLGFLLLHGLQGWCPPLPILRRLGVRTRSEIDRERLALKYLRGDFRHSELTRGHERPRLGALVGDA